VIEAGNYLMGRRIESNGERRPEVKLANVATVGDDRRTAGQSERDDQEQHQYRSRSYSDALEKPEKGKTQTHGNIVRLPRRRSEITMVMLTVIGSMGKVSGDAGGSCEGC
jgi:hypothetical protein